MGYIASGLLAVAGVVAALFVSPESGNFAIVQAAAAILMVVGVVGLVVLLFRRS